MRTYKDTGESVLGKKWFRHGEQVKSAYIGLAAMHASLSRSVRLCYPRIYISEIQATRIYYLECQLPIPP